MALPIARPRVFNSSLLLVSISPLVLVFTVTVATYGANAISASPSSSCPPLGKSVLLFLLGSAILTIYIFLDPGGSNLPPLWPYGHNNLSFVLSYLH
jgi:hypothetical protein